MGHPREFVAIEKEAGPSTALPPVAPLRMTTLKRIASHVAPLRAQDGALGPAKQPASGDEATRYGAPKHSGI